MLKSIRCIRSPGGVFHAFEVSGFSPKKCLPAESCISASRALNSTSGKASFNSKSNFACYPSWFFMRFCNGENAVQGQAATITSGRCRAMQHNAFFLSSVRRKSQPEAKAKSVSGVLGNAAGAAG